MKLKLSAEPLPPAMTGIFATECRPVPLREMITVVTIAVGAGTVMKVSISSVTLPPFSPPLKTSSGLGDFDRFLFGEGDLGFRRGLRRGSCCAGFFRGLGVTCLELARFADWVALDVDFHVLVDVDDRFPERRVRGSRR